MQPRPEVDYMPLLDFTVINEDFEFSVGTPRFAVLMSIKQIEINE